MTNNRMDNNTKELHLQLQQKDDLVWIIYEKEINMRLRDIELTPRVLKENFLETFELIVEYNSVSLLRNWLLGYGNSLLNKISILSMIRGLDNF